MDEDKEKDKEDAETVRTCRNELMQSVLPSPGVQVKREKKHLGGTSQAGKTTFGNPKNEGSVWQIPDRRVHAGKQQGYMRMQSKDKTPVSETLESAEERHIPEHCAVSRQSNSDMCRRRQLYVPPHS